MGREKSVDLSLHGVKVDGVIGGIRRWCSKKGPPEYEYIADNRIEQLDYEVYSHEHDELS